MAPNLNVTAYAGVIRYVSSRADVMPKQLVDSLSVLQDSVPPRPFAEVGQ